MIEEMSSDSRNYRHDLLRHGICTSGICSSYQGTISECLEHHYKTKYQNLGLVGRVEEMRCETPTSKYKVDAIDLTISVFLGVYVAFVLSVTIWLEIVKNKSKRDTSNNRTLTRTQKCLSVFSIFDNMKIIVDVRHQDKDYMPFLQTIRFVLSVLVIFGHVKGFDKITPLLNPDSYEKEAKTWFHLFFSQGKIIVSIFFVISSWLMAIKFFRRLKAEGYVDFGYVVRSTIKRYIRFTSGQILIVALHGTLLVHLFRGPLWETIMGTEHQMCRENWWTNLLYVGNFAVSDGIVTPIIVSNFFKLVTVLVPHSHLVVVRRLPVDRLRTLNFMVNPKETQIFVSGVRAGNHWSHNHHVRLFIFEPLQIFSSVHSGSGKLRGLRLVRIWLHLDVGCALGTLARNTIRKNS
ncbi:nose resistant to fluoxetine protein 6-like isoform X4 [Zophobas morio]|uniref:nose resistant to fluoxetine protein 6-like isoform X4 n=1 Tax=Zophobas morio TaxID=2755281 RepID=UPI003083BB3B